MSEVLSAMISSFSVIIIIFAIILFGGEPDISDSIRHFIDKKTEMLSCQKP